MKDSNMSYQPKTPAVIQGTSVKPRDYEWLWRNWLLNGKLNLLVGEPAVGKSALMAYMVACALGHRTWPGATQRAAPGGYALWIGSEEDAAESLRPQLDALGVPPDEWGQIVHGHDKLCLDVRHMKCPAPLRMVIVDPLIFGHGADTNRADRARKIAEGWQDVATARRCCVLAATHTVKHAKTHLEAGSRLEDLSAGSGQFVAVARMVWLYLRGSDRAGPRILFRAKCSPHIDHKSDGFEVHAHREERHGMWQPSRFTPMDDAIGAAREMVRDVGDTQGFEPAPDTAGAAILKHLESHGGSLAAADCKRAVAKLLGKTPRAIDFAADTLEKHGRIRRGTDEYGRRAWTVPDAQTTMLDDDQRGL